MEDKHSKLLVFGQKTYKTDADIIPLQHFMEEEFDLSEITEVVPKILQLQEAPQILTCMFLGLTQKLISQQKRLRILETIIKHFELNDSSNLNKFNIVSKLVLELEKLKTVQLVKLSNVCMDLIRDSNSTSKISWKELLPRILSLISDKKEITSSGVKMSGIEYKKDVIRTLCTTNVNPPVIVPLASMFTEIPMTSDEHERVVKKLCETFHEIDIKNLPLLVQQLLRLCKDDHSVIVFLKLRTFFSKYLYSFINEDTQEEMDGRAKSDIIDAENAILLHIEDFARISRLNDLMKLCKNASNASCLLLDPFLLAILLILSCIPAYEAQVSDLLRTMIIQAVCEEERKKESAWLSGIIDYKSDIDQLFSSTIQSRLCEHEKVVKGLMNLGFLLLSVANIKIKETSLKKIWRVGRIMLVSLLKKHRKIAKLMLQTLTDRIITGSISQQYTDCLLHLCNVASVTMVDNFSIVIRILEFISSMPGIVSQRIVTALIPLVQISSNLRDNLIMCLRKALFSRNIEIRQTAVLGFLQLLKFLKLQKMSSYSQNTLTQSSFQGPSVFTQICMDVHSQQTYSQQIRANTNPNVNEAICLEVVGILKRCFIQQASVKTTLYKGLFNAISVNPELCTIVLDVLLDHFNQYYENDADTLLPPLIFDKVISVQNGEPTIQEPIGRFLLLIQDVLGRTRIYVANEKNEEEHPRCLLKFSEIFTSLVDRFALCDLNHFQLDENTNMTDSSPESLKIQEIVGQILSVYEALMAYLINSWNFKSPVEVASKLISLQRSYYCIADFAKNSDKNNKKKDSTVELVEKKRKSTKKERNSVPKKSVFKTPPTILSLKTINRMLSLYLLDEVEWSSKEAIQEIKPRRRLFSFAMNAALDAINQMKVRLSEEQRSSAIFNEVTAIAKLLFLRCLSRYNEISEYEVTSAITSIECFSEIISLILTHYKSKFPHFLQDAVCVAVSDGLPKQLLPVLKVYKNLLMMILSPGNSENNETSEGDELDPSSKILTSVLLNALSTVVLALPVEHETTNKILDWLVFIAEKHTFPDTNSVKTFVNLLLVMQSRCRSDLTLLDTLSLQLYHIFPSINEGVQEKNVRPLLMVSENSKTVVLSMLCSTLMSHLDDADYMITRFKSEFAIVSYLKDDEEGALTQCSILKRRERELCQHVLHITLMTKTIISIAAPTGPCLESLIKVLTRNFTVLTSLTKYFTLRSSPNDLVYKNALFHKLVKVAGSQFLRQEASELLLYVEKDYENETKKSVSQLATQAKKQFILLPKLVSELECFPKAVMQLSKKCKDPSLSNYVKLTITRDFRLNVKKVDELISKQNESDTDEDNETNEETALSANREAERSQKRRRTS